VCKAFDTVPRNMLWYKLIKTGIHGKFLSALQSLYDNVKCSVKVNDCLTPWFKVDTGVKQGCLLSPSLFAIYINDLRERINRLGCGIQIDDIQLSILLYADDIVVIAPDESKLQLMLNEVAAWCQDWKLQINPTKTKIVHFRNASVHQSPHLFYCGTHNLDYTNSYKYLGLWVDEHLTMDKAVKELSKSASKALGALFGRFISAGGMTWKVYNKLYTSMVEPILFYESGIWGTRSHNVINNVQTKAAKYFLAVGKRTSNVSVRGDLGLTTCLTKQKLSCIRLKCKLLRTDDDRLTSKVAHWASRRRKGWHFQVDKFISEIDASDVVTNVLISVKTATHIIQNKLTTLDHNQFVRDLNDDRRNINGNKLRTYRLYKTSVQTEHYVSCQLPRTTRRTMSLFRSGALPLAVETGRYSRPQIPLNERLCKFCNTNSGKRDSFFDALSIIFRHSI